MTDSFWTSWGTTVTGPVHLLSGIPNQDAWISRNYKWGNILVVSDGLGSKAHSDLGAKAVCFSVLKTGTVYKNNCDAKPQDILRLIHANWLVHISPLEAKDCSATCLFVIHINNKLLLGRLGDGSIALYSDDIHKCVLLNEPKNNSFSNVTHSLSDEFNFNEWEVLIAPAEKYSAILLCTDGIADDILPEKQIDFAKELYVHYKDLPSQQIENDLKRWLTEWPVPGHTDDKTIACLFKRGSK